jgi:vacuolar-type H+-ATPase subunit E/Vma4
MEMATQKPVIVSGDSSGELIEGKALPTGTQPAGMEKIRELLFGDQIQEYDRRFTRLERRFQERLAEIGTEAARGISVFESNAKRQVDSIATQIREESDTRAEADRDLERIMREMNQAQERRIRALTDQVAQLGRDMADSLTREVQTLRDEMKRRNDDLKHLLEEALGDMNGVKTDRSLLAGLFLEVANCLGQDGAGAPSANGGRLRLPAS